MTLDTDDLRQKAEAATAGPWFVDKIPESGGPGLWILSLHRDNPVICRKVIERDASYIAAANPATILALLDELAATRTRLVAADRVVEVSRAHSGWMDAATRYNIFQVLAAYDRAKNPFRRVDGTVIREDATTAKE